jgi:hypothetical protein
MGKPSKQKGDRGEREVKELLQEYGWNALRTPGSGGREIKGDLYGPDKPLPIHVEVKRVERLDLPKAIAQAQKDAETGVEWAVFHRKNRQPWYVTTDARTLLRLLKLAEGVCVCDDRENLFTECPVHPRGDQA